MFVYVNAVIVKQTKLRKYVVHMHGWSHTCSTSHDCEILKSYQPMC